MASAAAGWGRPIRLVAPFSRDVIPPQAAFSSTGATALGFGVEDIDNAASSSAYASTGQNPSHLGRPHVLRGAQQTLALGYAGSNLVLLVGSSPQDLACCSKVGAVKAAGPGGFGAVRTLVRGLLGATTARLVSLPGRLLGAIASERGVWVTQSGADGHFGPARRLTGSNVLAEALDATSLAGNQTAVAWAATNGNPSVPGATTPPGARSILVATGSVQRSPRSARVVVTVPADHWIDELALAANSYRPTVAWIESWYDAAGVYHAQVEVADVSRTMRPIAISPTAELASGLAFAADAKGDQVLAWKGCSVAGACVLHEVLRSAGGRFGSVARLGAADATQAPAAAVSPSGQALVAWIAQGHVLGAAGPARRGRLGSPQTISRTGFAADLSLAAGPAGQALATWTQGTLAQSVVGAVYTAR